MEEDFICPNCQKEITIKTNRKEIEEGIIADCPFCVEEIELGLINLKKGYLSNLFLSGKISYEQALYYEEDNENLKKIVKLDDNKIREIEKIILSYHLRYKEEDLIFEEEYEGYENEDWEDEEEDDDF